MAGSGGAGPREEGAVEVVVLVDPSVSVGETMTGEPRGDIVVLIIAGELALRNGFVQGVLASSETSLSGAGSVWIKMRSRVRCLLVLEWE